MVERVVVTQKILKVPFGLGALGTLLALVTMQVCAVLDATDAEVLEVANRDNPCGTEHGWVTVERSSAVTCLQDDGRVHLLVTC